LVGASFPLAESRSSKILGHSEIRTVEEIIKINDLSYDAKQVVSIRSGNSLSGQGGTDIEIKEWYISKLYKLPEIALGLWRGKQQIFSKFRQYLKTYFHLI
jgi:hypothetical protein